MEILQQEKPDDFVISTGENYSIEDFCKRSFLNSWFRLDKICKIKCK